MRGRLRDLTFGAHGEQHITVTVSADFREQFDQLRNCEIDVAIKKWRAPRSKDANAYFHVLVNKIAAVVGSSDNEVKTALVIKYGALAQDTKGNTIGAMLPETADVNMFYPYTRCYKHMVMDGKRFACYLFYKRTHELNSEEMSRLIDGTISDARELGIDTDTPEQIARYKIEWSPDKR